MKIAEIEAKENVKTTYCILLHNEYYNILDKESGDIIKKIREFGHEIGLHFDADYYGISDLNKINEYLIKDKKILESVISEEVRVFSFHTTTQLTIDASETEYGGMINTYNKFIRDNFSYCSDSNGYWRFRRLKDLLNAGIDERIHILTHPVWWQDKVMSSKERIDQCIDRRAMRTKSIYEKHIRRFNRKNIDWE